MAEIINLNETPLARLKKQLEEREAELLETRAQLAETKRQLGMMVSVNELLRLQIQDLLSTLQNLAGSLTSAALNLKNIQGKLPKF